MNRQLFICLGCMFAPMSFCALLGEDTEKAKTIEKQVAKAGLVMVAVMPRETIAGSTANLKITVKNNSDKGVEWLASPNNWGYQLSLLDSQGESVPLTRFGRVAYGDARRVGPGYICRLVPGKETTDTLNIARAFDLTREGEYSLTISLHLSSAEESIALQIEKLRFKVIEEP